MRYLLTITEMAKLRNTTSETLRYYDKIGLFKPDYVSDSGHRYYSIRQYERLGTILELRQMGMPINKIQKYFDNRNYKQSIEILRDYQKEFEEKLNELMQLNEAMTNKIKFLESLSELPEMETVFETEFPERYMITFNQESGDMEEHAMHFTKLEAHIKERIPVIASDRMGVFAGEILLQPNEEMIPAFPMIMVSPLSADEEYLKKIPAGKYVCMYYKNGILEKYDKSFEIIKEYIREKNYRISGWILQFYKLDVTLTNDRKETILEIQIPVK
ncbi:MAG: MerR family transcriptional regulator [Candidatus Ornithomonoglobus sp.]